jgi:hypothetical protein
MSDDENDTRIKLLAADGQVVEVTEKIARMSTTGEGVRGHTLLLRVCVCACCLSVSACPPPQWYTASNELETLDLVSHSTQQDCRSWLLFEQFEAA